MVAGTQYTVTAYALNSCGDLVEKTTTFTTLPPTVCNTPTVVHATGPQGGGYNCDQFPTRIKVYGQVTNIGSQPVTEWGVEWGTTVQLGNFPTPVTGTRNSPFPFTVEIPGPIVSSQTYYYRVYARNSCGVFSTSTIEACCLNDTTQC